MKQILVTVIVIALVGAFLGGTFALSSDTESSSGNTSEAGTVDISVNGNNPWSQPQQVVADGDTRLKPSQVGYTNHTINNVGNNAVHVWGRINDVGAGGGVEIYVCHPPVPGKTSSEAECAAEIAAGGRVDNLESKIDYDLKVDSIEVIAVGARGTLSNRDGVWIYLGKLDEAGGVKDSMLVEQSYHLQSTADSRYQGDIASFRISFWAGQVEGACTEPSGNPCRPGLTQGDETY